MAKVKTYKFTSPYPLETVVLFLVFNRPDPTWQIFGQGKGLS